MLSPKSANADPRGIPDHVSRVVTHRAFRQFAGAIHPPALSTTLPRFHVAALCVVAGCCAGALVGRGDLSIIAIALCGMALLLVVADPRLFLPAVLLLIFAADRLVSLNILPPTVRWLPDMLIVALGMRVLAQRESRQRLTTLPRQMVPGLGLLLLALVASLVVNPASPAAAIVGFRYYLRFPVMFALLLSLAFTSQFYFTSLKAIFWLVVFQAPICLAQYASSGTIGDLNTGTMELHGGQQLFFLCLVSASGLLIWVVVCKRSLWFVTLVLPLAATQAVAGVLASLAIFPATLCLSTAALIRRHLGRAVIGGVTLLSIFVLMAILLTAVPGIRTGIIGPMVHLWQRHGGAIGAEEIDRGPTATGRIAAVRRAAETISDGGMLHLLFGYGAAATSQSVFVDGTLQESLSFRVTRSQMSVLLLEIGWVGCAGVVTLVLGLIVALARVKSSEDPQRETLRLTAIIAAFIFIGMLFYAPLWAVTGAAIPFWFLCSGVLTRTRQCLSPYHGGPNPYATASEGQVHPWPKS